jgi:hypothetical protein
MLGLVVRFSLTIILKRKLNACQNVSAIDKFPSTVDGFNV